MHFDQAVEDRVAGQLLAADVLDVDIELAIGFAMADHQIGVVQRNPRHAVQPVARLADAVIDGSDLAVEPLGALVDVDAQFRESRQPGWRREGQREDHEELLRSNANRPQEPVSLMRGLDARRSRFALKEEEADCRA